MNESAVSTMVGLSNGVINLFESSALQIANGAQLTENKVDFFINPKEDTNNSLMKKCALRWSRKIGQLIKVYSTGNGGIRNDEATEVHA